MVQAAATVAQIQPLLPDRALAKLTLQATRLMAAARLQAPGLSQALLTVLLQAAQVLRAIKQVVSRAVGQVVRQAAASQVLLPRPRARAAQAAGLAARQAEY
jgi:hypothetical protein